MNSFENLTKVCIWPYGPNKHTCTNTQTARILQMLWVPSRTPNGGYTEEDVCLVLIHVPFQDWILKMGAYKCILFSPYHILKIELVVNKILRKHQLPSFSWQTRSSDKAGSSSPWHGCSGLLAAGWSRIPLTQGMNSPDHLGVLLPGPCDLSFSFLTGV